MTRTFIFQTALAATLATAGQAAAQSFYDGPFPQQGGEAIYKGICQGCHMPDGKGAVGAGAYPALGGDKRLQSGAYPAMVIVRGQKAMPPFANNFSDQQVADVVNYIRTHFGNAYADKVGPETVKALRPPPAAEQRPE
jgi:mono/diheme cytochrome c family protein